MGLKLNYVFHEKKSVFINHPFFNLVRLRFTFCLSTKKHSQVKQVRPEGPVL